MAFSTKWLDVYLKWENTCAQSVSCQDFVKESSNEADEDVFSNEDDIVSGENDGKNEMSWHLVDENDPCLFSIEIGNEHSYVNIPHDDDWKGFGESIGRNTQSQEIFIDQLDGDYFDIFSQGIDLNQSINTLKIYGQSTEDCW